MSDAVQDPYAPLETALRPPDENIGLAQNAVAAPVFTPPAPYQSEVPAQDAYVQLQLNDKKGVDQAMDITRGNLAYVAQNFGGIGPEAAKRATEITGLMQSSGLGLEDVLNNHPEVKANEEAIKFLQAMHQKDENGAPLYPHFIQWAQDPINMAKSVDDVPAIQAVEHAIRMRQTQDPNGQISPISDEAARFGMFDKIGGPLRSLEIGTYKAGLTMGKTVEGINKGIGYYSLLDSMFGTHYNEAAGRSIAALTDAYHNLDALSKEQGGNAFAESAIDMTINAVPQIGLGAAATLASGGSAPIGLAASSIMAGVQGGALTYADSIGAGNTETQARIAGASSAVIMGLIVHGFGLRGSNAVIGDISRRTVLNNVKEGLLAKEGVTETAKKALSPFTKFFKHAGVQGVEQGVIQMFQSVRSKFQENPNLTLEQAVGDVVNSAITGVAVGSSINAGFGAINRIWSSPNHIQNAHADAQLFGDIVGAAKSSEMAKNDPQAFSGLINSNLESQGLSKNLAVSVDDLANVLFQDKNARRQQEINQMKLDIAAAEGKNVNDPEFQKTLTGFDPAQEVNLDHPETQSILAEFVSKLGVSLDKLKEARTTGQDLELNIGDLAAKFKDETLLNNLKRVARFNPDNPFSISLEGVKTATQDLQGDFSTVHKIVQEIIASQAGKSIQDEKAQAIIDNLKTSFIEGYKAKGIKVSAKDAGFATGLYTAMVEQVARERGETVDETILRHNLSLKFGKVEDLGIPGLDATSGKRGAIQTTDAGTVIHLFEKADLSSFLHESAHLMLNEMKAIEEGGKFTEQFKKDMDALRAFAGEGLDVGGQEKIAKAFERYLSEGKAPSVKLRPAFQRFSKWITRIYQNIKGYADINDNVRGVFDRMLASQAHIEEAGQVYLGEKALVEMYNTTEAEKTKVREARAKAQQSALDKQTALQVQAYLKAIGGKEVLKETARKEIENHPLYKILEAAKAQKITRDSMLAFANDANVAAAVENHGASFTKENVKGKTSIVAAAMEAGYEHPEDFIKDLAKLPSKDQAIGDLANQFLKAKEKAFRDNVKDPTLLQGDQGIHNKDTLDYLVAEAQVLQDKINKQLGISPVKIEAKAISAAAMTTILDKKISEAGRPDRFLKAEQTLAKKVRKALTGKTPDLVKALSLLHQQMLSHAMALESIKARDFKAEVQTRYRGKNMDTILSPKTLENKMVDPIIEVASRYGLTDRKLAEPFNFADLLITGHKPAEDGNEMQNRAVTQSTVGEELYANLPEWVRQPKDKEYPQINPKKGQPELTYEQLLEVDEAIGTLRHFGNAEMKTKINGKTMLREDFINQALPALARLPRSYNANRGDLTYGVSKKAEKLGVSLIQMQFLADKLDNYAFKSGKDLGIWSQLYFKFPTAEAAKKQRLTTITAQAAPHWGRLHVAVDRINQMHGFAFDIPGVEPTQAMIDNRTPNWTAPELVSILLNTGNAHNLAVLTEGKTRPINLEVIKKVSAMFTEKELQAIQGIWDVTHTMFDDYDKAHFELYNRHLPKVEANPITLPNADGTETTLKGGYYPLVFDSSLDRTTKNRENVDVVKQIGAQFGAYDTSRPRDGSTKSRITEAHQRPILLQPTLWSSHVNEVLHYTHFGSILRDFDAIVRDPRIEQAITQKMGAMQYDEMLRWMTAQARPEVFDDRTSPFGKGVDRVFGTARSLATSAVLGFKVVSGLAGRSNYLNLSRDISPSYMVDGLKQAHQMDGGFSFLLLSTGSTWRSKTWEHITSLSPVMDQLEGHARQEATDITNRIGAGGDFKSNALSKYTARLNNLFRDESGTPYVSKAELGSFVFGWWAMNDRTGYVPGWLGAFKKYTETLAKAGDSAEEIQRKAAQYADATILRSVPSAMNAERNAIQRDKGVVRLFTMFKTWQMKFGNRIMAETGYRDFQIHDAANNPNLSAAERMQAVSRANKDFWVGFVLREVVAEPLIHTMLYSLLGWKALNQWDLLFSPVDAMMGPVPLLSELRKDTVYSNKAGELQFNPGGPLKALIPNLVQEGVSRGDKLKRSFDNGDDADLLLWNLARFTNYFVPIPVTNIMKDLKDVWDKTSPYEEGTKR